MTNPTPFACNMSALSPEQRVRHRELEELLRTAIVKTRELADGYEFEFALTPANDKALSEITPLEHACCPFFNIAVRVEESRLFWRLSGREGVKRFIRMEFAAWFK